MTKRVNESQVNQELKKTIERDVIENFENKHFNNSFAHAPEQPRNERLPPIERPKPTFPETSNHNVDNLEQIRLKSIPDEPRPTDLYNRIVQLKVNMQREEDSGKVQHQIQVKKT